MKKVLIISSIYTGHGHMSISNALKEQLTKHADVEVTIVDGFTMGGPVGVKLGKIYAPMTKYTKEIWKFLYLATKKYSGTVSEMSADLFQDSFLQLYNIINPDLIISVHAGFVGSILNVLDRQKIKIPYVTVIADIVSISDMWIDARCDLIVCPSHECYEICKNKKVPVNKLLETGFPVRQNFNLHHNAPPVEWKFKENLNCLIMSGGDGVGNLRRIALILLENFNFHVTVVAGRNNLLKKRLDSTLGKEFGDRITVLGFVDNVQDYMLCADIVSLRGSPNSIIEAVNCTVPVVVTGALPGQEAGNPEYVLKYNLGVICEHTRHLKRIIMKLMNNNCEDLKKIRESQKNFIKSDAAKDISDAIIDLLEKGKA